MINDLPYDITHLTIGIQKVAELIKHEQKYSVSAAEWWEEEDEFLPLTNKHSSLI